MKNTNVKYKVFNEYSKTALEILSLSFPTIPKGDLRDCISHSIQKRMCDNPIKLHNNYTNRTMDSTIMEITEYILDRKPIMTAFGVLYAQHGSVDNPIVTRIKGFMDDRDILKKKMFDYPKGSEEREKYNLFQLLKKLDANGFYGIFGQSSCLFYNIYCATSITTQGRSLIASACLLFESFLANNAKFNSLDELITFIYNVKSESNERSYDDELVLDRDITPEECFYKLTAESCGFNYVPDNKDLDIIWDIVVNLDRIDRNRIYYKNNLYAFMENKSMTNAIVYILKTMKTPFIVPEKKGVPKEVDLELHEFCGFLLEYVYYPHQHIDRFDRFNNQIRSVSVLADTDSSIVSLDAWYNYVYEKIEHIDMPIKHVCLDPFVVLEKDEFGDFDLKNPFIPIDTDTDYNFYDEESIEFDRGLDPFKIIPQDNVRYSIINIMAYCMDIMVNDYMYKYCQNSNSQEEGTSCLIKMKNEFLFRRLLLTNGKKFYAVLQELQEGNLVPADKSLEIKGLPMAKGTLNPDTRDRLKKILYEEILKTPVIDQVGVIKELAKFEKDIYQSLISGDKKYYKPSNIKSITAYPDPMGQQGIKGAVVYNELRDPDMEAIDLYGGKQNIDIIKLNINKASLPKIQESNPDKYEKIVELMKIKQLNKGIDCIALPKNEKTPSWLLDYIDFHTLISDNVKHLPIESIGIFRGRDTNAYTNILKLV